MSDIGLPKGMSRDDAYVQGIADTEERLKQMFTEIRMQVLNLRSEARRTKTIYGGSDFSPVDYKVLTGTPEALVRIADALDAAVDEFPK